MCMPAREVLLEAGQNEKRGDRDVETQLASKGHPGHVTSASGNIGMFHHRPE